MALFPASAASEENFERDRNFVSNQQMYNHNNKLKCTSCGLEFDSSDEWLQHVSDNVRHFVTPADLIKKKEDSESKMLLRNR